MDPTHTAHAPSADRIGPYRLKKLLGRGAFGSVFLVEREGVPGALALKLLQGGADEEAVARFEREARLAMQQLHPAIVRVLDVGQEGGRHWYVMEHVSGESLQARLRRGPLGLREGALLVRDLSRAVAAAHARGIVHRDLKPANVILSPSGPRLLDFGLARESLSALTASADSLGTPAYMAPEQVLDARQADARSDVYGLGGILFASLSGQHPNPGATPVDVMLRLKSGEAPPPLRALRPDAPEALGRICAAALARRPEDRTPSADALREQLDDWLGLSPGGAATSVSGAPGATGLAAARRPAGASPALTAIGLLLLGGGIGVGLTIARSADEPLPPAPAGASAPAEPAGSAVGPAPASPPVPPPPARPAEPEPPAAPEEAVLGTAAQEPALRRARDRLTAGDPAGALAAVEEALTRGPRCTRTWALMGEACLAQGQRLYGTDRRAALERLNEAARCLANAERLDPTHADLVHLLGYTLYLAGRHPEAIAKYDRALELDPRRPQTLANRGYCRMEMRDRDAALRDFARALEVDARYGRAYVYRAVAHQRDGNREAALADLDAALKADLTPSDRAEAEELARVLRRP